MRNVDHRWPLRRTLGIPAVICLSAAALAIGLLFGSTGPANATGRSKIPTEAVPRSILAKYADGPHIRVEAKLVTLASVAAIDPNFAECFSELCGHGELVWLVLQDGPPYSFPHPTPSNYRFPPGFATWRLSLVDAASGVPRNVSEVGNAGDLSSSPWGRLKGLTSTS